MFQLVNKQRRFRRSLVKTAERAVIDVGVCSAEQLGHGRVVLKAVDVLLHVGSKDTQEVVKHGQGGDDVIISQMGVLPCETEDLQQGFELVGLQAWSHDTCHPEGIEVKRMNGKKREVTAIPAEIVVKDIAVIFHVLADKDTVTHEVHKGTQAGLPVNLLCTFILLKKRVYNASEHGRYRLVCVQDDVEAGNNLPGIHLDGRNLYDVILKDIQAGGFRIKDDVFALAAPVQLQHV